MRPAWPNPYHSCFVPQWCVLFHSGVLASCSNQKKKPVVCLLHVPDLEVTHLHDELTLTTMNAVEWSLTV